MQPQEKKVLMKPEAEVYKRIKKLGEGSFGKVYLVRCLKSNTLYALKQIDMNDKSPEEVKKTFSEAKILESLKHPNIVNFHEVYKTKKGRLCIVMDYADGGDIAKKIEEAKVSNSHFNENLILDWFTQISLALKHVHDRKIIHRDLKTSNIFLTKENTVKLGDFGIATVLNNTSANAKTVIGSPYYLSPEIIDNKPYNFKTDIWSLGVILYELCALSPPFNGNSLSYLAIKIVRGEFTPLGPHVSKDIKNLVASILNLDPNKRPNINEILKMPVITNRIKNFLSESMRKIEFSHTIIHNQLTNNQSNTSSKKTIQTPAITNKLKTNASSVSANQKKAVVNNTPCTVKKQVKHEHEPIKNQKAEPNKDAKLKAIIASQEKKEEEERRKKENKEKEREEERKMMIKDIEKKKMSKNQNEDYKIEWMGGRNEDVVVEKPKEEENTAVVNKPKSKTQTHKKEDKSHDLDKKTRLTRDQLKQMKKNVKKNKEIPVEIFLPKTNKPEAEKPEKEEVPLVQINLDLKDQIKSNPQNVEEESKDSEEKSEKLEENVQSNNSNENEEIDPEKKENLVKPSKMVDFLEDLEKDLMEIDRRDQLKRDADRDAKKIETATTNEEPFEDNDLENMLQELTLLVNPEEIPPKEKKVEINIEEIKKNAENQEDRDDDPEDLEEFSEEAKRISQVPENSAFGFLPDQHKIDSLRNLLKEVLGEEDFSKAHSKITEELKTCELEEIDIKYGEDNYKELFPFMSEENIQKYLPLLFTFVILEQRTLTAESVTENKMNPLNDFK